MSNNGKTTEKPETTAAPENAELKRLERLSATLWLSVALIALIMAVLIIIDFIVGYGSRLFIAYVVVLCLLALTSIALLVIAFIVDYRARKLRRR